MHCYPLPYKQNEIFPEFLDAKNADLVEIEKLFCSSITAGQQNPWPVGEQYALKQLIAGDLAANNGDWVKELAHLNNKDIHEPYSQMPMFS